MKIKNNNKEALQENESHIGGDNMALFERERYNTVTITRGEETISLQLRLIYPLSFKLPVLTDKRKIIEINEKK